ncbi:MAG: hypothetical protein WHV60_00585 [Bacteroidota bacterium]
MLQLPLPNRILILLLLLLDFTFVHSNEKFPLRIERISTDYNGVAFNGKNILAYGKYGIITYSTDKGETWNQICLGDKLDILKIIELDGDFYALTPYSILKSTDDGLNWVQRPIFDEPTFRDFTTDGKFFYIISEKAIFRIDHLLKGNLETFYQFEFSSLNEIEILDKYLFCIESWYYIYKINIETKESTIIDLHQTVLKSETIVRDISHLKVFGSTIFVLAENINQNNSLYNQPEYADINIRHYLLKSSDYGENWEISTRNVRLTKEYQIFDDTVYFLTHKGWKDTLNFNYYYTITYFKIDSSGNEKEINNNELLDRSIDIYTGEFGSFAPNTFRVNMFTKIDNETIIAVGPNKTILRSKNNGANWELVSYFKPIVGSIKEVKFFSKDTILVLTSIRPFIYVSFNGGATFLPPKRNIENFPNGLEVIIVWDDGTFALINQRNFLHTIIKDSSNYTIIYDSTIFEIFYSKDFGQSFSKKKFKRSYILNNDSLGFKIVSKKVYNDKLLLTFGARLFRQVDTIPDTYFYFFDKSFNVTDSVVIPKKVLNEYSHLLVDSTIFFIDNPFLLRTSDFGKHWDTLYTTLSDNNSFIFYYKNNLLINKIIVPKPGTFIEKMLIFDLQNFSMDSIETYPFPMSFFNYNDTIFGYKPYKPILYKFPLGIENIRNFDSIDIAQLLNEEGSFIDKIQNESGIGICHILKKVGSVFYSTYSELNLAKIVYDEPKYLPVEPKTDRDIVYFYHTPPYPMPARNIVQIKIYWDGILHLNEALLGVYDVMGNKVEDKERIRVALRDNGYGEIEWECSEVPAGPYFILLRWTGGSKSIPVVVE